LSLLLDFEERLFGVGYLCLVGSQEVLKHRYLLVVITLVEEVALGSHIPSDIEDLVGPLLPIVGHNDGPFEFS
jgi:hypothetical protein